MNLNKFYFLLDFLQSSSKIQIEIQIIKADDFVSKEKCQPVPIEIQIDSFDLAYDDGKWHRVSLTISKDKINFTIDTGHLTLLCQNKIKN